MADDRGLRRGALGLLAVTATKVFLYDLAELTAYRAARSSCSASCCSRRLRLAAVRPRGVETR